MSDQEIALVAPLLDADLQEQNQLCVPAMSVHPSTNCFARALATRHRSTLKAEIGSGDMLSPYWPLWELNFMAAHSFRLPVLQNLFEDRQR